MDKSADATVLFELDGIDKRFGGTQALDNVSLRIRSGEIHAIVGENGAGKSTLGKVIAGVYQADRGTLTVNGAPVDRWNPGLAQKQGVAMIAQELALVPDLTVAQNVFLGAEQHRFGFVKQNLDTRLSELDRDIGFGLNPSAKVRNLSIADQQKVEILRSLARNARVIVMDEPTSSLTAQEMTQLENLMRTLSAHGCSVIYVSHFLDSVLEVADRITVMRDGKKISTVETNSITKTELVSSMLGRELDQAYPERTSAVDLANEPILKVQNLRTHTGVEDMSFEVRPGEIVGLLGLVGSGRSECARAVFGVDTVVSGVVKYAGKDWSKKTPKASIQAGLGFVTEDRHQDGLVLERSIRENMSLANLAEHSTAGVLNTKHEKAIVIDYARMLEMRPLNVELPAGWFSGGNQQKALLGKALSAHPKLIILDEPTRGVDVGAKRTIYELIADLAQQGIGVLLISSEHEEIMELAHRAYLISDGKTLQEIIPKETTVENVLYQLFNVTLGEEPAA